MEWSSLFLLFFVGWLGASGWGLYEQMKPSPCNAESPFSSAAPPGMSSSSGCLRPLFPPSERVDVRIYATLDTRLGRWRSKAAFSALVPLWSKLNVSLSERVEASATLPNWEDPLGAGRGAGRRMLRAGWLEHVPAIGSIGRRPAPIAIQSGAEL